MLEEQDLEEVKRFYLTEENPDLQLALEQLKSPWLDEFLIRLAWLKILHDAQFNPDALKMETTFSDN